MVKSTLINRNFVSFKQLYGNSRMAAILALGFSSGLPIGMIGGTLQAWLNDSGVQLRELGFVNLIRLPYSLKFLWAPILDRFQISSLGRRRGWIVFTQLACLAALIALGQINPKEAGILVVILAAVVAFLSASQDIAVDAYRTEILNKEEYGAGASTAILGYRIGAMLFAGGLTLILADTIPWSLVYIVIPSFLVIGTIAALRSKEPEVTTKPRTLREALIIPIKDILERPAALEILAFIILYKLGDNLASAITIPFYQNLGFSKGEIGIMSKWFGSLSAIFGGIYGGTLLARKGLKTCLFAFGLCQMLGTTLFALLALSGKSQAMLAIAIVGENLFAGMAAAAQVALLTSLCRTGFSASQYALLTSLASISIVLAGSNSGVLVEMMGWTNFFFLCTILGIPSLLLLSFRFTRWQLQ